jgi:hypothetical protein
VINTDGLFGTVIDLAKLGFVGVGVVVFLLIFLLLVQNKPVDAATAALRNRFLTWGIGFAAFSACVALAAQWMGQQAPKISNHEITLAFSPSFVTRQLPVPTIKLMGGQMIGPDTPFKVDRDMQVLVVVDEALANVDAMRSTVAQQSQSVTQLAQRYENLLRKVPVTAETAPTLEAVRKTAQDSQQLSAAVSAAIAQGNFVKARDASTALKSVTRPMQLAQPVNP